MFLLLTILTLQFIHPNLPADGAPLLTFEAANQIYKVQQKYFNAAKFHNTYLAPRLSIHRKQQESAHIVEVHRTMVALWIGFNKNFQSSLTQFLEDKQMVHYSGTPLVSVEFSTSKYKALLQLGGIIDRSERIRKQLKGKNRNLYKGFGKFSKKVKQLRKALKGL